MEQSNLNFTPMPPAPKTRREKLRAYVLRAWRSTYAYFTEHPHTYLWFCFLVPFALMGLAYALWLTYPFGPGSVLVLDLNGQYVYFFEGLRDLVYGNGSVLYSFSRAMGGEFMGMYAYYLASPLSYLVALFPKENITEALYFMFVLKTGLSGLTMGIYLERVVKTQKMTTVIFSVMYALSSFAVVMQHNTMWTDNLILLPMVALGIEEMIRHRKYKLYTFSLIICIMSNFYIGYMTCIFVVLYCLYAYFGRTKKEINPNGEKNHFLRCLGQITLFSVIAVLISAIIIIPTYYSLQFGKNEFDAGLGSDTYYAFTTKFDLIKLLPKLFFGSYDTLDRPGMPILFCGSVALLCAPFFFTRKDIRIREKVAITFVSLFLVFSFNINTLDKIWHGFQAPNWLNYRYAFMLVFLFLIMGARGFEDIRNHPPRTVLSVTGVMAFVLCVAQLPENKHIVFLLMMVPALVFLCLGAGSLIFVIRKKKLAFRLASIAVLAVVCLEMLLSSLSNLGMLDYDVNISSRQSYRSFLDTWQPAVNFVQKNDDSFYRMEKTAMRKYNDPFGLGYRGLSGSTSTLNAETIKFLHNMGLHSQSHLTAYSRPMPVSDSLLGVKYMLTEKGKRVYSGYEYVETVGNVDVYRNPMALPIAFAVNRGVAELTLINPEKTDKPEEYEGLTYVDSYHPADRFDAIFSAMLAKDVDMMIPVPYQTKLTNLSTRYSTTAEVPYDRYIKKNTSAKASITFTFRGNGMDEVFFYVPSIASSGYQRNVELYVDGKKVGNYFANSKHSFADLGAFPDGEEHTLEVRLLEETVYFGRCESFLYYLDHSEYETAFRELQEGGLVMESYTEDHFLGKVTVGEGKNAIQTTLAYDKGWNVYVDGKPVETYKTLNALLAFDVEEGEHTIEMRYFPKEYKVSLVLFAGGCVMLLAILVWDHVRTVKKKKAAVAASAAKEPSETEADLSSAQADTTAPENGTSLPDNDEQPKGT